jgi:hypothetical protein
VAHDDARRAFPLAVDHVKIGMAHAGRDHPHGDLAVTRRIQLEILDARRLVRSHEHGTARAHRPSVTRRTGTAGTCRRSGCR